MRTALALGCLVALSPPVSAQAERYELGRRLRLFEEAWETADEAGRARALKAIRPVTTQFLTFQLTAAARTLDDARFALTSAEPRDEAARWADSLAVTPAAVLADVRNPFPEITVKPLYPVKGSPPTGFTVRAGGATHSPAKLPFAFTPEPPTGDGPLTVDILGGTSKTSRAVVVTRVEKLAPRLKALRDIEVPKSPTLEQATVADRAALLSDLAAGDVPETDLPLARLLVEVEAMAAPNAAPFFTPNRPGTHSLTVPTAGGKRTPCRLLVPGKLDPTKPVPLVVALHGMGGSENLFFDGYGAGCVAKACKRRGWLMVSPRGGLGFLGGPPPVAEIVEKLAERYPIDRKRVFLVGHSMGSAQAVELAQKHPGAFAAVACLGGGGKVRKPAAFDRVPVFVGVGTEDFALSGAKGLFAALPAGAKRLQEYPGVEHTLIVRVAVDDVFAHFERK